jgi:predicted AAA+ superfamily ATPase
LSAKRISGYLKSQNIRTSIDTVIEYLGYFEDARVLNRVRRHDLRGKKILETHEKFYPGDIGLRNALLGYRSQDIGIQLECVVCQHLLASGWDVTVGRWGEMEVDFVARRDSSRLYLQVAYLMTDESTLAREIRPLRQIPDQYPKMIVSMDPVFREDHDGVRWMPVRDFLQTEAF